MRFHSRVISGILLALCLLAMLTGGMPALTVRMMGVHSDVTVFGISEFFAILGSFNVNRLLAGIHIAPLAEGLSVNVGIVDIPVTTILSTLSIGTLGDLVGELPEAALPIRDLSGLQFTMRLLYGGTVLALALAQLRRMRWIRLALGLALCGGMGMVYYALLGRVAEFHGALIPTLAMTLGITPSGVHVCALPFWVFMSATGLYGLVSCFARRGDAS